MKDVRITHIGGPTTLIELDGRRLLTDPTFDPPGRKYNFGWGTRSRRLAGPAIAASDLAPVDAVLLTHDHHVQQDREAIEREFAKAPEDIRRRIQWLPIGVAVEIVT